MTAMFNFLNNVVALAVKMAMLFVWIVGIVLAHGTWSTIFSVCIPPYAIYLVVEKVMLINGWI